jgi:predicted phage terminase large subunit-like protein
VTTATATAPETLTVDPLIGGMLRRIATAIAKKPPVVTLADFLIEQWTVIEPNTPLTDNWHLGYIGEHLEAVTAGEIQNLLVNMPPRYLKSILVTVMWPCWEWTTMPWLRYLFASYDAGLSTDHSLKRRTILEGASYRTSWGDWVKLAKDQNQKTVYQNTAMGVMQATSYGGGATGKGGDRLVLDDLMNPKRAESDLERKATLKFYDDTLATRLNDPKTGVKVIVEQRLHKDDLTAHVLKHGTWTHIDVQAQAEARRTYVYPRTRREKTVEAGEVLCEARHTAAMLEDMKRTMGTRTYGAQYQQRPSEDDSAFFNRKWWQYYRPGTIPPAIRREWSWDTALKDGQENDYSVGVLMSHCANGTYLERVVRGRLIYPDLKRTVLTEWEARQATVIIEDNASGISLGQDLKRGTRILIAMYKKPGDKVFCANMASPTVEGGRVFLPEGAPWVADFVEELSQFPFGEHDDQVDAFSQGINRFYQNGGAPKAATSEANLFGRPVKADWE